MEWVRTILNFMVAWAIINQIWNLLLSTLGIDNPYLYEDYDTTNLTNITETPNGRYVSNTMRYTNRYRVYKRK